MFCQIVAGDLPGHLVLETDDLVAFLDTRPVFKGHVLLVPRTTSRRSRTSPRGSATVPGGGPAARDGGQGRARRARLVRGDQQHGQPVRPHLHLHVVPRTKGDGLRGFFWPRTKYADGEAAAYAERLRAALIDG